MIESRHILEYLQQEDSLPFIDVRSESEFAKGHIPGAVNIPLLNDAHRVQVGTLYKQSGKESAVLKGFQLAGPRFYELFKLMRKSSREQSLKVYCWRGGMRSNIMAWMMHLADYNVQVLQGGYKAYRHFAHELFSRSWKWLVLSGKTGTGKTALLQRLQAQGEQVLDFEALANHKGSAFGHIGLPPQPTVEHFENLIARQLQAFNSELPVWIENESRFIGQVRIPDALYNQTLAMPVVEVVLPDEKRKALIWQDYGKYPVAELVEATEKLSRKLGGDRMQEARQRLTDGDWQAWLDILLPYYDKTYAHSSKVRTGKMHTMALSENMEENVAQLLAVKHEIWKTL